MYNLTTEIAAWRKTILETESCTESDINELESHLNEEIDQLKTQSLTEEEAFLVAACRIGKPAEIAAEYTKVNRTMMFKKHILWACTGILALSVITHIASFTAKCAGLLSAFLIPYMADLAAKLTQISQTHQNQFITSCCSILADVFSCIHVGGSYTIASIQIIFQMAIFIILAIVLCKLVKKGRLTKSLLAIAVTLIIVLQIGGNFIPMLTFRFVSIEQYGKMQIPLMVFGMIWSLMIPLMLAVMIKKFRPQKSVTS